MRNCDECNGTGKVDSMNCDNQSNECCGGCYKEVKCEECDGSGEFKYWHDIEYEFQTMMHDWNLTREELNYLIENTNFKI